MPKNFFFFSFVFFFHSDFFFHSPPTLFLLFSLLFLSCTWLSIGWMVNGLQLPCAIIILTDHPRTYCSSACSALFLISHSPSPFTFPLPLLFLLLFLFTFFLHSPLGIIAYMLNREGAGGPRETKKKTLPRWLSLIFHIHMDLLSNHRTLSSHNPPSITNRLSALFSFLSFYHPQ